MRDAGGSFWQPQTVGWAVRDDGSVGGKRDDCCKEGEGAFGRHRQD